MKIVRQVKELLVGKISNGLKKKGLPADPTYIHGEEL